MNFSIQRRDFDKKITALFLYSFQEVMILKIYLDVVFLENFLMDYILLLLTGKILQKQKKGLGMMLAASIGSGYSMLYFFLPMEMEMQSRSCLEGIMQLGNLAIAYLMVRCAYKNSKGKQGVLCVLTVTVLAFVTGGILTWAEQTSLFFRTNQSMIFMSAGAICFGYLFLQRWTMDIRRRWFRKTCHLPVILTIGGQKVHCCGLMDSGNSLYEPITRRPVIIVEQQLLIQNEIPLPDGFFVIPYNAIGTQRGFLKGVLADELEIPEQQGEQRWRKVMLGIYEGKVSQKDEYQVILHPKL